MRILIEYCVVNHLEDWVNELFLSCRFEAQRKGPFNEYVYNFFKCLSMERLQYAEGYYAEKAPIDQFWESNGYRIQRRCPHLKADLSRFAEIENGVLSLRAGQPAARREPRSASCETVRRRRPDQTGDGSAAVAQWQSLALPRQ